MASHQASSSANAGPSHSDAQAGRGGRRRWVVLVALALLLGAVTNVLVAWGIMFWHASKPRQINWDDAKHVQQATAVYADYSVNIVLPPGGKVAVWTIEGHDQPGKAGEYARDHASRRGGVGAVEGFALEGATHKNERAIELVKGAIPAWVARLVASDRHIVASEMHIGWPATALRARAIAELIAEERYRPEKLYQDFLDVPKLGWLPKWMLELGLPVVPVWPGFLINLCVYVPAWLIAFWLVGSTRRALRRVRYRRRVRCEKCGYDLRGLSSVGQLGEGVCPECGEPRRANA